MNSQILSDCYSYINSNFRLPEFLIYNSIDIRQASFKSSPVDNNIFPAGFNNIGSDAHKLFAEKLKVNFAKNDIKNVILLCEDHTRNSGYLKNVRILHDAITNAGAKCEISTLSLEGHVAEIEGTSFEIGEAIIVDGKLATVKTPNPDSIILNNDLSGTTPENEKLQALIAMEDSGVFVMPSAKMGWNNRKKSSHFVAYQKVVTQLSDAIKFDPWLINAEFSTAQCLNFSDKNELTKLADCASDLFKKIKVKYKEYKISSQPAIFLKSESGTYGLGVEKVSDAQDLLNPNRTFRKKILYNKSKTPNTQFLLQEGVPTMVSQNGATAECTTYSSFGEIFGGFYRIHKEKTAMDNLNSKGAEFSQLEQEIAHEPSVLNLIAKLSSIAVTMESF
jgi:glutamate--cysteine ligase